MLKDVDLCYEAARGWSGEGENKGTTLLILEAHPLYLLPPSHFPGLSTPARLLVKGGKPHRTGLARTQVGVSGICSRFQCIFNFRGKVSRTLFPRINYSQVPKIKLERQWESESLGYI